MSDSTNGFWDEISDKYLDEILGLFPIHRVFLFLISIPLAAAFFDPDVTGVVNHLATTTPLSTLKFYEGSIWRQSWAAWGLIVSCYLSSLYLASLCPKFFRSVAKRSKHNARLNESVKSVVVKIETSVQDTTKLQKCLFERCQKRIKSLSTQQKCAELLLFLSADLLLLSSKWQPIDAILCLLLFVLGVAIHFKAYRFYIKEIAPWWVLLGCLEKSYLQPEDAYH